MTNSEQLIDLCIEMIPYLHESFWVFAVCGLSTTDLSGMSMQAEGLCG